MKNNKMLVVALIGLTFGMVSQMKAIVRTLEFDLGNKSGNLVYLSVEGALRGSRPLVKDQLIVNGGGYNTSFDGFDNLKSLKITITNHRKEDPRVYMVTTGNRDACYLTYGKQKGRLTLHPQVGKFGGLMGKNERGYAFSKSANVKAADIFEEM